MSKSAAWANQNEKPLFNDEKQSKKALLKRGPKPNEVQRKIVTTRMTEYEKSVIDRVHKQVRLTIDPDITKAEVIAAALLVIGHKLKNDELGYKDLMKRTLENIADSNLEDARNKCNHE